MEIGAYTFANVALGEGAGAAQRIPELLEEIALADEAGLDVFGVGEHHRPGFGAPAPAVLLAAAAARTSRIRLTSAVTVLGSDDPVRVFEQFAALDLVSRGRAEIMVGRGALTDSFRLFGYDLGDYDALFDEKLRLLLLLRDPEPVTWSGRFRPSLKNELIMPRPAQEQLPVWIGGNGNPNSVVRAASLGLPLALGTISGTTRQYAPIAELYREALEHYGKPPQPMAFTTHGFVADTSQQAAATYYPAVAAVLNLITAEQGMPRFTAADIAARNGPGGTSSVGSPGQVAEKLLEQRELLGHQRAMIGLSMGPVPHRDVMRAIELLGTEVAPVVRAEVARRESAEVTR